MAHHCNDHVLCVCYLQTEEVVPDVDYIIRHCILGTHTSGNGQDYLMLAGQQECLHMKAHSAGALSPAPSSSPVSSNGLTWPEAGTQTV